MKVLVDTSMWIDFLREGPLEHPEISAALENGSAALCPVTWLELWSGLRGKREQQTLETMRETCAWLEIDTAVWARANSLSRAARESGLNCPMADILIVACAKENGAGLIHRDKHIDQLVAMKTG